MKSAVHSKALNVKKGTFLSSLLSFFIIAIFCNACKEQIPGGLVLTSLSSVDTSYVTTQIEAPQDKKVVIEELTGASCVNCPAGTKILNDLVNQHPNRIILTAMHSGFLAEPPAGALYDFRNADADALVLYFNEGSPPKPSATFDRVPVTISGDTKYFILKGSTGAEWVSALNNRLSKTSPVNIHLTSAYDINTNKVNVTAKLHFTDNVTGNLGLTLYVLENNKVDIQDSLNSVILTDYKFNHILQKVITPIGGEAVLDSLPTKVTGRVLEKNLSFEPNISGGNAWNLDNCVIVAIVHKTGATREILHAEEVHLK